MKQFLIYASICFSMLFLPTWIFAKQADSLQKSEFDILKNQAVQLYNEQENYRCLLIARQMIQAAGKDSLKIAITHYTKGAAYNQLRNAEQAYTELTKALRYFRKDGNSIYLAQTYAELAQLSVYRGNPAESLEYYSRAYAFYEQAKNHSQMYKIKGNMAIVQAQMGQFEKAIHIFKEVRDLAFANKDSSSAIPAYLNIGQAFLRMNQPDSARDYLQQSIEMSNRAGKSILEANGLNALSSYYFTKGDYRRSITTGSQAQAIFHTHHALKRSAQTLERMASAYSKLGNYQLSNDYLWKYVRIEDSIHSASKEKAIAEVEGKLLLNEKENSIALLKAKTRAGTRKQFLYLSLFGLALAISVAVAIKLRNSGKLRRTQAKVYGKQMQLELTQKEQLKSELALKTRSLTKEGLRIIQKNNQLKELQEKLDSFAHKFPEASSGSLQKIRSSIQYAFSVDKDWDEFSVYFEEVHPQFLEKLNAMVPDLTPKEKRLSALLKVNMSTKEIASVLGIAPESVKKARNRLRKKLELKNSENLNKYLQTV